MTSHSERPIHTAPLYRLPPLKQNAIRHEVCADFYFRCSACGQASAGKTTLREAYAAAVFEGFDFSEIEDGNVYCESHRKADVS